LVGGSNGGIQDEIVRGLLDITFDEYGRIGEDIGGIEICDGDSIPSGEGTE
jgi:hypothetical protein